MDLERVLHVGYGAATSTLEMLRDPQIRDETWQLLSANPNAFLDLLEYKGRTIEAEARQWLAQTQANVRVEPPTQTASQSSLQTVDVTAKAAPTDAIADLVETLRRLREDR